MVKSQSITFYIIGSLALLIFLLILNISFGSVSIPFKEVVNSFLGTTSNENYQYIIINYRLPKALVALLVGAGLSLCGLMMQTLFRNPLAGPYVLGLSSGSSLGVALLIMGSAFLPNVIAEYFTASYSIILASVTGSLFVLVTILLISRKLKDTMTVLIIGLMFSSFSAAIINVLSYFSTAEQLQRFTFWSMGSLGNLSKEHITILFICICLGVLISLKTIKPLNALLLGENYAKSLGIPLKKTKYMVILATSLLSGSITAFAGPIAFIGLAVPHIAKLIFNTSDHKILFFTTLLLGSSIMLICDLLTQIPSLDVTLPINAITSLFGAPIVIWLIVKKRKMMR
jgi:iron complex transport system permease protein